MKSLINTFNYKFNDINDYIMVSRSHFGYKILSIMYLLINLIYYQKFYISYQFEIISFIIKQIYIFFLIRYYNNNRYYHFSLKDKLCRSIPFISICILNSLFNNYLNILIIVLNNFGNHTLSSKISIIVLESNFNILLNKSNLNFIDYSNIWLFFHLLVLFLSENLLVFLKPSIYNQDNNKYFMLKSHQISLFILGICHPFIVVGLILKDFTRVFNIYDGITPTNGIQECHYYTVLSANIFTGYLIRDCINGLIYNQKYRKEYKYNISNWIHHLLFILVTIIDLKYCLYSDDYIYLIMAEISTIFLYLREVVKSNLINNIFIATFLIFRIIFYSIGSILTLARLYHSVIPDIPWFAILITPISSFLGILINIYWFLKIIKYKKK